MSARKVSLFGVAAGAALLLWYFGVLERPATQRAAEQTPVATLPAETVSSADEERPASPTPVVQDGESAAAEAVQVMPESERIAVANAQKPIEDQPPEIQSQYYKAWLEGLTRSQNTQQEMLERLQAEREQSTPEMRTVIDERIAAKQKTLQERANQIALYQAKVGPSQ